MEQRHRKAIKKNLVILSKDLDFPALEPYLLQEDVYPEGGKLDVFKAIKEKSKQNVAFLSDIKTRGPNAFGVLVTSLILTGQEHCANWLDPTGEIPTPQEIIPPSRTPFRSRGAMQEASGQRHPQLDEPDQASKVKPWENNEHSYPVSDPRGIVLIINNEVFVDDKTLADRLGTNKDCETIEDLFRNYFGFLVVKKQNLSLEEMKSLFELYQQKDHSKYSCFVSVILSHGENDGVCGTDYDKDKGEVLKMEDVVDIMDHCSTLAGKPKIFFTQACRGEKMHKPPLIETDAKRAVEDTAGDRELSRRLRNLEVKEKEENGNKGSAKKGVEQRSHVGSDVLVAYPTIKGYVAARETDTGTWFIRSLCQVLKTKSHCEDLCSMMTMVNSEVGGKKGSLSDGKIMTQTSEYTTTLKKKLYFPPKPPVLKKGVPQALLG